MRIATKANVRTAEAAKTSLPQAMKVAFRGGTVMGLGVAGLAVFGLSAIFALLVMQGGRKSRHGCDSRNTSRFFIRS